MAGYQVVDVDVNFYDGKMHPVDSNDISFQVAGYWAFKEAFLKARPCLLEPIHSLEIRVPEDCVGKVIGDLSSRRGKVVGMDSGSRSRQSFSPWSPARELYRYASQLRSSDGGRGLHTEEFSHYEELPARTGAERHRVGKKGALQPLRSTLRSDPDLAENVRSQLHLARNHETPRRLSNSTSSNSVSWSPVPAKGLVEKSPTCCHRFNAQVVALSRTESKICTHLKEEIELRNHCR